MQIISAIGKYSITAAKEPDNVIVSSDNQSTLESILDGIELMGGAFNEDQSFSGEDIHETKLFGRPLYQTTITRTQLTRYFEYEILNFLTYPSLAQMRSPTQP